MTEIAPLPGEASPPIAPPGVKWGESPAAHELGLLLFGVWCALGFLIFTIYMAPWLPGPGEYVVFTYFLPIVLGMSVLAGKFVGLRCRWPAVIGFQLWMAVLGWWAHTFITSRWSAF